MTKKEIFEQLRNEGKGLEEIGKQYGISKQRVFQILNTTYGERPIGRPKKSRQLALPIYIVPESFLQKYYRDKELVLTHYGKGKCACVLCGFDDIRALSIDHINGNGLEHRKQMHASNIYRWLVREGFPKGFRTLCMNCQWVTKTQNKFVRKCQNTPQPS